MDFSSHPLVSSLDFARKAHAGQRDKAGLPYFGHVERVARSLAETGFRPEVVAAGALHDVIDDCGVSFEEVADRFGEEVAHLVLALSKERDETYFDYILALLSDARAAFAKLADLEDNLDPRRPYRLPAGQRARYEAAQTMLRGALQFHQTQYVFDLSKARLLDPAGLEQLFPLPPEDERVLDPAPGAPARLRALAAGLHRVYATDEGHHVVRFSIAGELAELAQKREAA